MHKDAAYSSGFVAIKQQELLDEARLERMIRAESLEDALAILCECGYDSTIANHPPVDCRLLLENELQKTIEFFDEYCIDERLRRACLKKFDYHNAKAFLKAQYSQEPLKQAFYPAGLLSKATIEEAIAAADYEGLPIFMTNALIEVESIGKKSRVIGREIDILLDRAMFEDISNEARGIESKGIRRYFAASSDICNLMIAARCKRLGFDFEEAQKQFVAGGKLLQEQLEVLMQGTYSEVSAEFCGNELSDTIERLFCCIENNQSLEPIEEEFDSTLLSLGRECLANTLSDEPLFAWYQEKMREFRIVRLIIICKTNNIDVDTIKQRLGNYYV